MTGATGCFPFQRRTAPRQPVCLFSCKKGLCNDPRPVTLRQMPLTAAVVPPPMTTNHVIWFVAVTLPMLLTISCESHPPLVYGRPGQPYPGYVPRYREMGIIIDTEPEGARIEVNDEYQGVSPITVMVTANPDGTWMQSTDIRALPIYDGQYVQSKHFYAFDQRKVPKRILFDMNLVRPRPSIDVNLNTPGD